MKLIRPRLTTAAERIFRTTSLPIAAPGTLVAGAIAFLLYFFYRDSPMLFPPQGRACVMAAHSIQELGNFSLGNGRWFARFGPLYPILLAASGKLGLSVVSSVVLVNAITLAASVLAVYGLARMLGIRRPTWAAAAFMSLAANLYLFRMARPDAIVPLAAMVTVLATMAYVRSSDRRFLWAVAFACSVAATARYMAIFTVVPVAMAGVWLLGQKDLKGRLLDMGVLIAVGVVPVAFWLLRNLHLTGYLTGMSRTMARPLGRPTPVNDGLMGNFLASVETIRLDFLGWRAMGLRSHLYQETPLPYPEITTALSVIAIALLVVLLGLGGSKLLRHTSARIRSGSEIGSVAALVAGHAAVYGVVLVIVWTFGNNDAIHSRYTAPMYWSFILGFFFAIESWRDSHRRRILTTLAAMLGLLVMVINVDKSLRLMGDSPSEHLIKKSLDRPSDLWLAGVSWRDFETDFPRLRPRRADRNHDEASSP